ncbi:Ubiquitin conjugation factor E4 [Dimargaris xerosporica]|nr:Ubiquitin conjugation factor E4 [Dimargaris xerosporica]
MASSTSVPSPATTGKTLADWQNEALSKILNVTLDATDTRHPGRLYLDELAQERTTSTGASNATPTLPTSPSSTPKLTEDTIDEVVVARLSYLATKEPANPVAHPDLQLPTFDYLLRAWQRAQVITNGLNETGRTRLEPAVLTQRLQIVAHCSQLLVSYMGISLMMPDMFPDSTYCPGIASVQCAVDRLLAVNSSHGIAAAGSASELPSTFWDAMKQRFQGDGLEEILGQLVGELGRRVGKENVLGNFHSVLGALMDLVDDKVLAIELTRAPTWLGDDSEALAPQDVAGQTLLGPFFALSGFPGDCPAVIESYFKDITQRTRSDVESCIGSLRSTVDTLGHSLFRLVNALVRASPVTRQRLLQYVALVLTKNEGRAKMQVDEQTVSSDGFILNWLVVLLKLCEPFMDTRYSKIDRIDSHYYLHTSLLSAESLTKVKASHNEWQAHCQKHQTDAANTSPKSPNFISDMFYCTLTMQHLGLLRMFSKYTHLVREMGEFKQHLDRLKEQRNMWANNPAAAAIYDQTLERHQKEFNRLISVKVAQETQILNPLVVSPSSQFFTLVMAWLVRQIDPRGQYPWQPLTWPLPTDPPETFAMLPEFFVEDTAEYFLFLLKFDLKLIYGVPLSTLVAFIVVFVGQPQYIKNPYLRAKLVEILFFLTLDQGPGFMDLGTILNTDPMALDHLAPALMHFYVEVEQTGASSQFYDKFNIRYNISQVLKYLRHNETHRQQMQDLSRDHDFFIRFINLLMNDTTFLLDESLATLAEIRTIQTEMANSTEWAAQPETYQRERESLLVQDERKAQSYVSLGNETVHMLRYLTKEVPAPFISREIVDRLAAMLNYNLQQMVGPKCTELKVKNREKYHFQPRQLLSEIIDIYLHLADHPEFVRAVANDGRSYNPKWFAEAMRVFDKYGLKSSQDIEALQALLQRVEAIVQENTHQEESLGEVPDEFLDPLMFTLMEDPVILPTSNVTVDRSTIKSHLLSDATDPFNRKPLTIDMIRPNEELKAQIEAFKRSKHDA